MIREDVIRRIVKRIVNEAMDDSFSLEELSSIGNYNRRVKYCREHLGMPIGKGSSRIVFQMDDEKVLKLAFNEKGVAQNDVEFDWGAQNYGVMPKLYDKDDDDAWIVTEYVIPAKKEDFKKCIGIDFHDFCRFVGETERQYKPKGRCRIMDKQEFETYLEKYDWLQKLYYYMCDFQPPAGDLVSLRNYGMALRDGKPEIVILDSGLNDEVLKDYYY